MKKQPKVWYSNPFSTDRNLGKAFNEFCDNVPDGDWICFQDGDMLYLTPDWGAQIQEVIENAGKDFSLLGCMTNKLGRPMQRVNGYFNEDNNIKNHYHIAVEQNEKHWGKVVELKDRKLIAGMFLLFPKSTWNKHKFEEKKSPWGVDDAFCNAIVAGGGKLGLLSGLYVYHLYRVWSDNPTKASEHVR